MAMHCCTGNTYTRFFSNYYFINENAVNRNRILKTISNAVTDLEGVRVPGGAGPILFYFIYFFRVK